ncbi:hypothetical protein L3081_20070 [Colwellia sp. MSW7]|uniref:Restriction endonuclease type IV Mrr domain-containing protein n=1 Tax=Colwellia maritima TaxID=2912588 RepID=A0ABS9X596_9GAMM|nr:hypothetical protein [Colwellia maritima]MCI2285255.1 hypothetical protein [Colwellia maritima]
MSNIAGGMAIVGDVGAITKNSWRATGWSDNEPNLVETFFSGLGLLTEAAVGFGEVADLPISVVKSVSSTFGDTPFTRTLATRVKDSVIEDVPFSEAESAIVKQLSEGDYALGKVFNEVVTSDELYKAAIRSGDKLGDDFLDVFTKIATDPSLGKAPAEALILVLSKSSDDVLKNIKDSPVPLLESLTAIAKSSAKVSPELMTKILGNDKIYSNAYKQGELLKDIGEIATVKGVEDLAKMLKTNNIRAKGFRYELESAAYLKREGVNVAELSTQTSSKKLGNTDIDIIADFGQGLTYVQVKKSTAALGYGAKNLNKTKLWIAKAQEALGAAPNDFSKILYVVPPGQNIPKQIREYLELKNIQVLKDIPHL